MNKLKKKKERVFCVFCQKQYNNIIINIWPLVEHYFQT